MFPPPFMSERNFLGLVNIFSFLSHFKKYGVCCALKENRKQLFTPNILKASCLKSFLQNKPNFGIYINGEKSSIREVETIFVSNSEFMKL